MPKRSGWFLVLTMVVLAGCTGKESRAPAVQPVALVPGTPAVDKSTDRDLVIEFAPPPVKPGPPPDLTNVAFLTEQTGFATTLGGGIYRTDDAGDTWREVFRENAAAFRQVQFADPRSGFAVAGRRCPENTDCDPALLARTTDGGEHWHLVQPRLPDPLKLYWNPVFVSDRVGYAVGHQLLWGMDPNQDLFTHVFATADGGESWQPLPLPEGYRTTGAIGFVTPRHGFVVARGKQAAVLLETEDGGNTWKVALTTKGYQIYSLQFVNERQGFAAGGNEIKWGLVPGQVLLGTTDGGATWHEVYRNEQPRQAPFARIHFSSPTTGWATTGVCSRGASGACPGPLLFTEDGGKTWTATDQQAVQATSVGIRAWVRTDRFQQPDTTVLYRTLDAGQTWRQLFQPAALVVQDIQFTADKVGSLTTNSGLYRTEDGGNSWRRWVPSPPFTPADRPIMIAPNTALVYRDGRVLRTEDAGQTWRPAQLPPGVGEGRGSLALRGEVGWLVVKNPCGSGGCPPDSLLISEDGGRTWEKRVESLPASDMRIAPGDALHAAAVDAAAKLLITADGGRTWAARDLSGVLVTSVSYVGAEEIWFTGLRSGATSGSAPVLAHSADRGQTWTYYRSEEVQPRVVQFVTPSDGWLITEPGGGNPGTLFVTRDGGRTWRQVWPELQL